MASPSIYLFLSTYHLSDIGGQNVTFIQFKTYRTHIA